MKVIDCFDIFLFKDIFELKINYKNLIKNSNQQFFRSNKDSKQYNIPLTNLKEFTDNVEKHFPFFKEKLGIYEKDELYFKLAFLNETPTGGYNIPHMHAGCILSGVYYFECNSNSGNLKLKHPSQAKSLDDYDYENYNSYNSSLFNIPPIKNHLYIFPNYLEHYVESNKSKNNRISLSFNIGVK